MDNAYRRDHELPYFADETIVNEQLRVKKAVRGYNAAMPFDPETGLRCMEEIGLHHAGGFYFEPPFHCEYGSHIHLGENPGRPRLSRRAPRPSSCLYSPLPRAIAETFLEQVPFCVLSAPRRSGIINSTIANYERGKFCENQSSCYPR